jgi:quercetin dioxygenase-like cupin family protein
VSRARPLAPRGHALYRLAPRLLLVFKPRGHTEPHHAHDYTQTLRVVSGRLEVRTARSRLRLDARAAGLRIPAGRAHATRAVVDTWVIVEQRTRTERGARTPAVRAEPSGHG